MARKAHAIDDAAILGQAKQARTRIALLRPWRDAADLDEPEPQSEQGVRHFGILVEAGGQPDRVGQAVSPDPQTERRRLRTAVARPRAAFQAGDGRALWALGMEARKKEIGSMVPAHAVWLAGFRWGALSV